MRQSPKASDILLQPLDPNMDERLRLDFRERIFARVVELAAADDTFRKRVAEKMRNLGEGQPKRSTSRFDVLQVVTFVEILEAGHSGTRKAYLLKKPRIFQEVAAFLKITEAQARKRYYLGRKWGMFSP